MTYVDKDQQGAAWGISESSLYDQARADDAQYVFHSWSQQAGRTPLQIISAQGSYVRTDTGQDLLDFSSQLVYTNIGHQHPRVVAGIQEQAGRLCTVAPAHINDQRSTAAKKILEHAPANMRKVFFTNGGAEAVENAIRLARVVTGRYKIASLYRSYHGGTTQTINVSGDPRRWPQNYDGTGAVHFHGPFLYRSVFHAETEEQECERALHHLEQLLHFEGPDAFAAILLETIPGTAGIMVPPAGYLAGVRKLCDKYGIVMILDEVMAGFGRTGAWFAADHFSVVPDLMTFAKGVNSGYVPLGGVIISESISAHFDNTVFPGGLTYSGHPLACAAAVHTITVMEDEKVIENAEKIGKEVLGPGLRDLARQHPCVGEVRGLGVFWALDLVSNPVTKEPLAPYGGTSGAMKAIVKAAQNNGLLLFTNFNRIHCVPPCTISVAEAQEGLRVLGMALEHGDAACC